MTKLSKVINAFKVDPITIEIIQSSLTAITDEMFATMRKTAVSSCLLYTSPSPRDATLSRMPSSA